LYRGKLFEKIIDFITIGVARSGGGAVGMLYPLRLQNMTGIFFDFEVCFLRFLDAFPELRVFSPLARANFADSPSKTSCHHTKFSWKTKVTNEKKVFISHFLGNFGNESRKFSKKTVDVRPRKNFFSLSPFLTCTFPC
jgi:hypothetical protein